MEEDPALARAAIFEIIDSQIQDNNPPETRQTLARLLAEGYSKEEGMQLIGSAMTLELFEILKNQETFNETRYIENLYRLPQLPWGDDKNES